MSKSIKTWIEEKMFWLKTGAKIEVLNNGESVDEAVIKFKDFYISVLYSDDEICSLSWSKNAIMFDTPIRDILVACDMNTKESKKG